MSCRLGMFAKYWQPGNVKTRLASSIGEEQAASIYRLFVVTLLKRCSGIANKELVATPDDCKGAFRQLDAANGWTICAQGDGDLGVRMRAFFQRTFDGGCEQAILIGSDSPTLPLDIIHQAEQLLQIHDVVLGPTDDGGYYLVGARRSVPPIFSNVSWSSDRVWHETVELLLQERVGFAVLPEWYDVDDYEGLRRLGDELNMMELDAALHALQQGVNQALSYASR